MWFFGSCCFIFIYFIYFVFILYLFYFHFWFFNSFPSPSPPSFLLAHSSPPFVRYFSISIRSAS